MTSAVRTLLSEALLWLSVFIIALTAFFFLDDRIGSFMDKNSQNGSQVSQQEGERSFLSNTQKTSLQEEEAVEGRVTLQAGRSGHFEVKAFINENSVNLLTDTGATYVVLTWEDAENLDLTDQLKFTAEARTANGVSRVAPIILDSIEVGDIIVHNVKAFVAQEGKLSSSLLGMSFIGRLSSFKMSGRELILEQ
ncbi:MAG: TIGR02281 family clan AA aspartic protease [Hyphomicrobiaceae bacterium]|nr:TIGR02281 family clan AA aspartic protease [Hyphomicrobiaceae bacterium]